MRDYDKFLQRKISLGTFDGFKPLSMPDFLFDFQKALLDWGIRKGRGAWFADCGLGKTPMELVWADNVVRKTNKRVLILTPLAVSHQTITEGEKFNIECKRSHAGELFPGIVVTNYQRLHHFNPNDFIGVVCDESSILKSFDGQTKAAVTEFMLKLPYRMLATATAAPNDYIELGTSSEALGELGAMDMLNRFFKNDQNNSKVGRHYGEALKWRFKGHSETAFWQWVCSWARAVRKPSDLGFADDRFILPPLDEQEHVVKNRIVPKGMFFAPPAVGLKLQREERRRTIAERCEKVVELVAHKKAALIWCHLNDEGDLLEKMIPGAVQISGRDTDEEKEEKFLAFTSGQIKKLVTKPKIGAWGLNFQHCNHIVTFASHSYEQYYQGARRCWRFGQTNPVHVDIVTTEGEIAVMKNLQRKSEAADKMFTALVSHMNEAVAIDKNKYYTIKEEVPTWL